MVRDHVMVVMGRFRGYGVIWLGPWGRGHDSRGRGHGFWGHGIEGHYIVGGYRVWVLGRG